MKIQYQCEVCDKLFEDNQLAEEHERTHPDYPPLKIGDIGTAKGGNPNSYYFVKEIHYNKATKSFYLLCNVTEKHVPSGLNQVTIDVDAFDKLDFRANNAAGFSRFVELIANTAHISIVKKIHSPSDLMTLTVVKKRK